MQASQRIHKKQESNMGRNQRDHRPPSQLSLLSIKLSTNKRASDGGMKETTLLTPTSKMVNYQKSLLPVIKGPS